MKYVIAALLGVIALALSVLAFDAIRDMLVVVPANSAIKTSYEDIVVILLTTVTVIFTVSALVMSVLGFLGPRAIKREAAKFAERAVLQSVDDALKSDGKAIKLLEERFPPHDGPIKTWLEDRINQQVINLLPLIIGRIGVASDIGPIDPNAPDDEGDIS